MADPPTHRAYTTPVPRVHAWDNRLDRFDGSDENYLIGYYATYQRAFTSSSGVVWRGVANVSKHRSTGTQKLLLRPFATLVAITSVWPCRRVRLLLAYRPHVDPFLGYVGGTRSANLICVPLGEIKLFVTVVYVASIFLIDARLRFVCPSRCVFSAQKNFI